MMILAIRTDKPTAELTVLKNDAVIAFQSWEAHRKLAESLHVEIKELLSSQQYGWQDIQGIVVYGGPGSFTGLRIGCSVANTLAASLGSAIVGAYGDDWMQQGVDRLLAHQNDGVVVPDYGAPVHITQPKK